MAKRTTKTRGADPKRAEEARQAVHVLRAAFEGASAAVFVKDRGGRYVMLNPAAARFLGKSPGELIGKRDTQVFPPQEAHRLMEIDRSVLQTGHPRTFEKAVTLEGVDLAPENESRPNVSGEGPGPEKGGTRNGQATSRARSPLEHGSHRHLVRVAGLALVKEVLVHIRELQSPSNTSLTIVAYSGIVVNSREDVSR